MRVITGKAKGKRLNTLEGNDVRPTTDKIKEAVFSALHFYLPGKVFLDLFAGSGQMGIEAISRGAAKSIFIDENRKSINIINENLKETGFIESSSVFNMSADRFINSFNDKVDIVFLDPPYGKGILQNTLENLISIVNEDGFIICENPFDEEIPEKIGKWVLKKTSKYGKIKISIYVHEDVC